MMKRFGFIGMFIAVMMLVCGTPTWAKDRVAVMDFENKAQYGGWRVGRGASDILTTELAKTGKFSVMERNKLASVMKEQDMGASGRFDPATAARIGKIIGVEYIITGAVTEYGQSASGGGGGGVRVGKKGYHASVDVRMVDATTGEIVFADSATASKSSMDVRVFGFGGGESFNEKKASAVMRTAIQEIAAKITSKPLTPSGEPAAAGGPVFVADVDGKTVTLNKGSNAGLKVGQKVTISRKGKVIKDPQTGKVLKIKYKKIGAIKLTEVEDAYAEGEVVSGAGFQIGDVMK
jgi:curli biogenesis system outer membrane secretion channel CsgG